MYGIMSSYFCHFKFFAKLHFLLFGKRKPFRTVIRELRNIPLNVQKKRQIVINATGRSGWFAYYKSFFFLRGGLHFDPW